MIAPKRNALLLALLFVGLLVASVQSLEQTENIIASYGAINVPANNWWGVVVSDTAWKRWGSYFGETQIDILKQSRATGVRIMLDKHPWETGDTQNVLGIPYKDYIKQLVDWCKPDMKVYLCLTRDSTTGSFGYFEKYQVITTSDLSEAWIDWGKEVIAYCQPNAIGIMNEPASKDYDPGMDYYINNFVIPSIQAYRSIDQNIIVFVTATPTWHVQLFEDYPINDEKVIYEYHTYNFFTSRQIAFDYLDWKTGSLPKHRFIIGEFGLEMYTDEKEPRYENWRDSQKYVYDYVKENDLLGCFQYGFTKSHYIMLDPDTHHTTWTPYGQWWVDNIT